MLRFRPLSIAPSGFVRYKTTRPQEWKDEKKYRIIIDPKQYEKPRDYYTPEKWMRVRWKGLNHKERKIHSIGINDTVRSDPKEAAMISMEKMVNFQKSLAAKR